ncbi:MAG: DDE-type integrase/transposase/recombinase [Cyclobacteriaceae bacterium]|nr:DDE-type integrase/transposase/recombinase [Cyclobacteriaceae bacterium]
MKLVPGKSIQYGGESWLILKTFGSKEIKIKNEVTKTVTTIPIDAIDLQNQVSTSNKQDLKVDLPFDSYSESSKKRAHKKFQIISSILNGKVKGRNEIEQLATENEVSVASIYNWLKDYKAYGGLRGLIDSPLKGGTRLSRINKDVETIMTVFVKKYWKGGSTIESAYSELVEHLENLNQSAPHINTFKKRIREVDEAERNYHYNGKKHADAKYKASPGKMPDGNFPLEIVQYDSTQLDIILVDGEGNVLGKPWLTIGIDTKTRSVLGFNTSFAAPSFFNLGRAIYVSVLPKNKYLDKLGLNEYEWDRFGKPRVIFTDNGSDFRSENFQEICKAYGITQRYRPKGSPKTGGMIERYIGTIKNFLKELPGYTKVGEENFRNRKPYKEARLTIKEFEKLFTLWILTVYHVKPHSAPSMNKFSPNEMWQRGLDGDEHQNGTGVPEMITNHDAFNIDLLPTISRTIGRTGVSIHGQRYYVPILNNFVNRKEKHSGGKLSNRNQKYDFKFNLSDISYVYFKNPVTKKFDRIENTDLKIQKARPSLYEYIQGKKKIENTPEKVKLNSIAAKKARSSLKKTAESLGFRKSREIKKEQIEKTRVEFPPSSTPKVQTIQHDEPQIKIIPFETKRN